VDNVTGLPTTETQLVIHTTLPLFGLELTVRAEDVGDGIGNADAFWCERG
jgi:hypothetical protein